MIGLDGLIEEADRLQSASVSVLHPKTSLVIGSGETPEGTAAGADEPPSVIHTCMITMATALSAFVL